MADIHLTREILRAAFRGELPARILVQIGLQHLMGICPHCRQEIEAFQRERTAGAPDDYSRTFELLPALLREEVPRLERERRQAERDLGELLHLPRGERTSRVRRARSRFRSQILVRLLIDESQKHIPGNPDEAFHLAELARTVANANPAMAGLFDLVVLATAHMANACRVGNDRRKADEHFVYARRVIQQCGVTDPAILARVDDLEGSLRKDQRLFAKAEELFARSAMLFQVVGARPDTARVLINLGDLYTAQGDPERAIETTRSALGMLEPESEPRVYLCGRYNLAYQLFEAGRPEEAAQVLETDEDLYRRFSDPWTQLRLTWLKGNLAEARGEAAAAEQAYRETRDGFIAQGIGYDAAMVSLDLALLYLRQGSTAEVRRLAEDMLPILEAQDVHREALAALVLFQDGARREELTVERVRQVAAFLKDARGNPQMQFGTGR